MWLYWMGQEAWMVKVFSQNTQGRESVLIPRFLGSNSLSPYPHPRQGSLHLKNPIRMAALAFWEFSIQCGFIRGIKPESMQLR